MDEQKTSLQDNLPISESPLAPHNRRKIIVLSVLAAFLALGAVLIALWAYAELSRPTENKATNQPQPIKVETAPAVSPVGHRFGSIEASAKLASSKSVAQAEAALDEFGDQYGIRFDIGNVTPSSYERELATFDLVGEDLLDQIKSYGGLFIDEWAKYPRDWVEASGLQSVALVRNYAVNGTHRAAGPDPVGQAMYYDVGYYGDFYLREVIHHEYDHYVTYHNHGTWSVFDPIWLSYNPPGFQYGDGGASCYGAQSTCLTGEHVLNGFATGYATSAVEEDRAETFAYLMTNEGYHKLIEWTKTDSLLAAKMKYYIEYVHKYSKEMDTSYFSEINP